jgi:trigger factor
MMGQFQMPPGQTQQLDLPDALFQDQAEKRGRVGLVVNEIMTSKEMVADAEKIELRLQEIAAPYGEPDQVIEWYKSNPEQMNNIEMAVLEDQVVDLIMHEAIVEEVVSNYADVISGAAIAVDDVSEDAEPGA